IDGQRTRRSGYAAASTLRHAILLHAIFTRRQSTASMRGRKSTEPRRSRKASVASRTRIKGGSLADRSVAVGVGGEERVAVVGRREERLLHRPQETPARGVPHRPRLVVRPARAGTAEGLLPDDGARRLVVHVEVAGGVPEGVVRLLDRQALGGEDCAGETIGRGLVDQAQGVVPAALVV